MPVKKQTAQQQIARAIEREIGDLKKLTNTDADRRLEELLKEGSTRSTGLEDIAGSVRRLRAL